MPVIALAELVSVSVPPPTFVKPPTRVRTPAKVVLEVVAAKGQHAGFLATVLPATPLSEAMVSLPEPRSSARPRSGSRACLTARSCCRRQRR